jgi:hypothetical protein
VQREVWFFRGDANEDGAMNISDAVAILFFLFIGGNLQCMDAIDGNDDGQVDLADVISLLSWLFLGADPLPDPLSACGPDPTEDSLDCLSFQPCPAG